MKIKLKKTQSQTISEFSNDVAKGLVLAGILGQGFLTELDIASRIFGSLGIIILGLFLLRVAVIFRKKI